ncbi:MAG: hypothetical protein ACOVJ6_08960 [Pirellulales bacterium]|jgi:hypothetical protein
MRSDRRPATVVVCCGVPAGASEFADWVEIAARSRLPVTWAVRPTEMAMAVDMLGLRTPPADLALALGGDQLQSRPTLRRELAAARAITGPIECVVVTGADALEHRALLVEQGVHTIAVGGFDAAPRSSRRPAPAGWPCRSVVWGLWEVQTVPEPARPAVSRWLPWAVGPRLAPGTLTVVHIDPHTRGSRSGLARFERLATWITRQAGRVDAARLSDLPDLLRAAGQRDTGSVLRQAA